MEFSNNVKRQMELHKGDPAQLKDWPYGGVKRHCLACHRAFVILNDKVAKRLDTGLSRPVPTASSTRGGVRRRGWSALRAGLR